MNYSVIDVREPYEFAAGHVNGAVNIPLGGLTNSPQLKAIPKAANIVVYCRTGNRSGAAKNVLQAQGYTNVTNGINQQQVENLLGPS